MRLALGLSVSGTVGNSISLPPLNFGSLINLPISERQKVQAAAYSAADNQTYSAQEVIDALAAVNFTSFLPADGCIYSDTLATIPLTAPGTIGSFKGWADTAIRGVSNAIKTFGSVDLLGLNIDNSAIELNGVGGSTDGAFFAFADADFIDPLNPAKTRLAFIGDASGSSTRNSTPGGNFSNARVGLQGATNVFYEAGIVTGSHAIRWDSDYISGTGATLRRVNRAFKGNLLMSTLDYTGFNALNPIPTTNNRLGSTAANNGWGGRVKAYAFVSNSLASAFMERVTRFSQFYFQDLVTTQLIDVPIIVTGTSITAGASGSPTFRWIDDLQTYTQAHVYGHGIGGNRITAPSTTTPWDNVMSARISEAFQASESYETVIVPYLNKFTAPPIVIIDHNVNDYNQPVGDMLLGNINRQTYVGALNFVADQVLGTRPDAIIVGQTGWPDARAAGDGVAQNAINQAMRDWTTMRDFPLIDVAAGLDQRYGLNAVTIVGSPFLFDSVHPTAAGHELISSVVLDEVARIFN